MSEEQESFIDPFDVQQIRVAVDAVCIGRDEHDQIHVLLIKREYEPFRDHWALPGGFLQEDEELEEGVIRELKEETKIQVDIALQSVRQIGAYGEVGRDPRPRRIVSVAFLVQVSGLPAVQSANESLEARWISIDALAELPLAFDHSVIIQNGLDMLNTGS